MSGSSPVSGPPDDFPPSFLRAQPLALVAQWIEQRFPKPCVAGSIPAGGTDKKSCFGCACVLPILGFVPRHPRRSSPAPAMRARNPLDATILSAFLALSLDHESSA